MQCDLEEGKYDELDEERGLTRRCQALLALWGCVCSLYFAYHLGCWKALQSSDYCQVLAVNNFYIGEGSDFTGVVTKMMTVNGSLNKCVQSCHVLWHSCYFHPHQSHLSDSSLLLVSLKKYFQPRRAGGRVVT
ncbi:hypothetical protein P3S67_031943 [Capsicum chacoense]